MPNEPKSPTPRSPLVVLFYLAATLVLTWPLAKNFSSHLPAVAIPYDALLHVFILGWGWHGLTTNPLDVFNAPIFYPEVRTLTYMDHMLGEAVLGGPVIEIFGLGVGYNTLIIFSFVASGYFIYRLALLYGLTRSGSVVAGFLFAFCPYRFTHLGCLNQIQTQFIPLGIFFAVLFFRTGRTRYGVGAALTLAVQSYFGWYTTFHLLAALVVLLGWEIVRERGRWRQLPWRKAALLAALSAILIVPSALPYVLQRFTLPEFNRPFSETVRLGADLFDYLHVNIDNILARFNPPLGKWYAGFFPGLIAAGLATVAIVAVYWNRARSSLSEARLERATLRTRVRAAIGRWGEIGYIPVLGLSGLVLSFGPFLQVAGHNLWIPLPYALFYYVIPGFSSMRTPGRFAVLVALATAVLAGLGFDLLRRRYPRLGSTFLVGTLIVAAILAWSPTVPYVAYADRASMPPVYDWLAEQPDSLPFLELPVTAGRDSEGTIDLNRQMYVLYHGKPRLDGASGFTSSRYTEFRRDIQAFPAPEAIRRAYDMGARRLIVHYGDWVPGLREGMRSRVEKAQDLREVAAFDQDVVYEIKAPGTP